MKRVMLGVVLALTLAAPADAASELSVTNAWLRALPGRLPAAGYFTLRNATLKPVTLSGAYSSSCGSVIGGHFIHIIRRAADAVQRACG